MKIKPAKSRGKVVVEMGPQDEQMLSGISAPPFRLQRILVPVDLSEASRKALSYALALARPFQSTVVLLYVVQLNYAVGDFTPIDYPALEKDLRVEAEKQLARLAAEQVGTLAPFETQVRTGRPATEITEAARSLAIDLIVLATHGHTGLKHVLLGSVAENVVRQAPCPVLTVREQERDFIVT